MSRTTKVLCGCLVVLFSFSILLWTLKKRQTSQHSPHRSQVLKHPPVKPSDPLRVQIESPVAFPPTVPLSPKFSKDCIEEGKVWLSFDIHRYSNSGGNPRGMKLEIEIEDPRGILDALRKSKRAAPCRGLHDFVLEQDHQTLWNSCLNKLDSVLPDRRMELVMDCVGSLLTFRMAFIDRWTSHIPLAHIFDERVLMQKMLASIFAPVKPDEWSMMEGVEKAAQRILELNPQNYPASMYLAKASLRKLQLQSNGRDRSSILKSLSLASDALEQFFPSDEKSIELQFSMAAAQRNLNKMYDLSDTLINFDNPSLRSNGWYLRAWTHYESGEVDRTLDALYRALRQFPQNFRASDALKRLQSLSPGERHKVFIPLEEGFSGIAVSLSKPQ